MSEEQKVVLNRVFTDVLEQMAFMFCDEGSPDDFAGHAEEILLAQMGFEGAMTGSLSLAVPQAMCPDLAANLLGTEPEDAEEPRIYQDALKELLNVTCGNVLTALGGEEPVFDLTVPEVSAMDSGGKESFLGDENTVFVLVDDFPLALRLTTGEGS